MVTHHLLDSLAVVPYLPGSRDATLADAGSGGGLPGIPIAIACPQRQVTLNDASEKKAAFLRQAAIELRDRKSTRLNSSHSQISYAVFCLKKKKKNTRSI